jgi:hypothetical protein
VHLPAGGDRVDPMSRAFNGVEDAANALDRAVPPIGWTLLGPPEGVDDLIVLPRATLSVFSRAVRQR